jgi:cold-inducible RNA-binding protein
MNKRLYIGNLAYSITNGDLEKLFSSEGNVVSARVIRRLDGKSKGFGFLEMETEEEASKVIEKYNETNFKDRTIYVNEAKPRKQRSTFIGKDRNRFNKKIGNDLNSKLRRLRKKF